MSIEGSTPVSGNAAPQVWKINSIDPEFGHDPVQVPHRSHTSRVVEDLANRSLRPGRKTADVRGPE